MPGVTRSTLEEPAIDAGINFRWIDDVTITIALDETVGRDDVEAAAAVFAE